MTTARRTNNYLAACAAAAALLWLTPATPAQEEPAEPAAEQSPAPAEPQKNPRRASSYSEALAAAGEDGVIVFCYGPDWNQRSVRMLTKFWQTAELEQVTGKAMLLAAPYYQAPTEEQESESRSITGGMPAPPFGVCPTVMMFDKEGFCYANLPGKDYLGDETGDLAKKNIAERLGALHAQQRLLAQADSLSGVEKAKILSQVADLPIKTPRGLVDMIREADPSDSTGLVRRNTHDAKQFLYEQMETKDGFLATDFVPDFNKIKTECLKVAKDEALRAEDRQAAYALIIGQARREHVSGKQNIPGKQMKDFISSCAKIDPNTPYGKLSPTLAGLWGNLRVSAEARKAYSERKKADDKARKEKEREDKKADKNVRTD